MYFRSVNEAGGIYNRKIELFTASDNYQPAQAVAGAKKLIARDEVFAFICSLGTPTVSMIPVLEETKTPMVGSIAANKQLADPPKRYFFMAYVSHYDWGRLMAKYPVDILKMKSPQFFSIFQDDDFGHETEAGCIFQLSKYNMELIGRVGFKKGNIDFSSQVARAKAANANVVLLSSCYVTTAQILKEAKRLEWKALFLANSCSMDRKLIELAGAEAAEGIVIPSFAIPEDEDKNDAMKEYIAMLKKYHPDKQPSSFNLQGWNGARIFCEGLRRAGEKPTREKFVEAMETFKDYETPQGGGLTYSPDNRKGPQEAKYYEAKGGTFEVVEGWTKLD
jgi:branched-chain amino acid transport system substrate-binding protein